MSTLLLLVQLFIHQAPHVVLCRACLSEFFIQTVNISGIAVLGLQGVALHCAELY